MTKIALLTFVFTMFFVSPALAEETNNPYLDCAVKKPTAEEVSAAKAAFVVAAKAFAENRFDDALIFFKEAYRHDCTAELLVHHIGMVYEAQQKYEDALTAYRAYVQRAKDPKDPVVKDPVIIESLAKISVLQKVLSSKNNEQVQRPAEGSPPIQSRTATSVTRLSDIKPDEEVSQTKLKTGSKWAPITTTVVGGVVSLVGIGLYADGAFERKRIEGQCSNYTCQDASLTKQGNDARERVQIGSILALSGLAVSAAGVGWLLLGSQEEPEKPIASVHTWATPSGGGLTYQRTF